MTPFETYQEAKRAYDRATAALIVSAATAWQTELHGRNEEHYLIALFDAVSLITASDLSDDIDQLREDLNIDEEGYPLTADGFTDHSADREYIPAEVKLAGVRKAMEAARAAWLSDSRGKAV